MQSILCIYIYSIKNIFQFNYTYSCIFPVFISNSISINFYPRTYSRHITIKIIIHICIETISFLFIYQFTCLVYKTHRLYMQYRYGKRCFFILLCRGKNKAFYFFKSLILNRLDNNNIKNKIKIKTNKQNAILH